MLYFALGNMHKFLSFSLIVYSLSYLGECLYRSKCWKKCPIAMRFLVPNLSPYSRGKNTPLVLYQVKYHVPYSYRSSIKFYATCAIERANRFITLFLGSELSLIQALCGLAPMFIW